MKKKSGFTLVEMLIVIVIIGILSSALLPRLTGYMAKTRDTKRHIDLKNIAAAIEIYRDTHGEMPKRVMTEEEKRKNESGRHFHHYIAGYASALQEPLDGIITKIPSDPVKNSLIKIYNVSCAKREDLDSYAKGLWTDRFGERLKGGTMYYPGEYFYYILRTTDLQNRQKSIVDGAGVLIAKVETPEAANYVLSQCGTRSLQGGGRGFPSWMSVNGIHLVAPRHDISELKLCSSVEKGKTASYPIEDGKPCTYTSADQLYYIVKIE